MPIQIDELADVLDDDDDDDDDEIHSKIPAVVELKIDGTEIDWTIESFELDQMAFDHHVLKIYLSKDIPSPEQKVHLTALNFFPAKMGSSLTLIIKASDEFVVSQNPNEFFGIITNLRFINNGTMTGQVLVEAKSPTWKMDQAAMVKTFKELSRNDIAQQILGDYAMESLISQGGGSTIMRTMTTQWMQTDWDFLLTTVLGETDRWVYYDGKKIVVDEAKSKDTVKLELMKNVGSVELRMNALQTKFVEYGWVEKDKTGSSTSMTGTQTSFSGMASHAFRASQELISQKSIGISDLSTAAADVQSRAEAMQNDAIGNLVVCYLQTNQPSIKVGNTIELVDMGPVYNGIYFVKRVTHCIDSGNDYYNYVEALPLESAKPPIIESDARAWRGDPVGALVTDNKDPESRGRVKVQFLLMDSGGSAPPESEWLHIAAPYAGADRGFYFMPEVGDEVLVGFFNGDIDHPVVLGGLWNGRDKPKSDWYTDQNDKKVIYTRCGHQLVFDDTDGAEKIEIIDKTGKNSIVIDSASNTITITADKDIVLKAKENISLEAEKDINLKATGKISLEATQDLSAKGMNATFKAQAAMSLEGTSNLEAKGAMVTIDSKGPNTIKGNPIMLN